MDGEFDGKLRNYLFIASKWLNKAKVPAKMLSYCRNNVIFAATNMINP